ncbi:MULTISPECIES: class IIb bacteriocin, lactobin A/cerein 7B family [Enterococcus]|uniref:class IIb bacteriocin, lactobin A/cerein 7B family n=1 Tax=Enterococcus TaxID=1350 RepID=UPI002649EA89|nr:class IIb bacteriocin, lactobin A/cerein 7B family [Enterococcus entomosocium]
MNNLNFLDERYVTVDSDELYDVNGGLIITIAGITFVGWKAAALIAAGVTTLAGAAALGFWNGYNDTKKK